MQTSLSAQVLRSPILAALLHGTRPVGVSQTAAWYKEWNYGTFAEGATYIRLGGHHAGHRPTFYLCVIQVVVVSNQHFEIVILSRNIPFKLATALKTFLHHKRTLFRPVPFLLSMKTPHPLLPS